MALGRTTIAAGLIAVSAVAHPRAEGDGQPPQNALPSLTLNEAVQEALDHNLDLLAARFNVTDAAVLTASLRPNPVVTASLFRPDQGLVNAGISPHEEVFRTDYVLERGSKRERRLEQANLAKSVAELQLLDLTRSLVLDVATAFTDVQLARLNLTLARDSLQAFNTVVQVNTHRVRAGDLSAVELSRSRLAALQFQNDVRQMEARLRADAARSVADLRLQLANGQIDYTVSGEYHRQRGAEVNGNAFGLFLSAPLPIFNRNQGEIARARGQQQQLEAKVRALEHEIDGEVANAYAQYASARQIVGAIERQMLTPAQEVLTTTEYSYLHGEASFVELLDAVRAFNDTMQSYNSARADYAKSRYTLDSISGKVNP